MFANIRRHRMAEYDPGLPWSGNKRFAERLPLRVSVQYRKGQSRAVVDLVDISTHGAKLSATHVLRKGDRFWLKLPNLAPQEARVAWAEDFLVGCEFVVPLHPSVMENLLREG